MKASLSAVAVWIVALFVFGPRGAQAIGNDNPSGPTGSHNGEITTGCSYDAYTGNAKREITDLVVTGAVGAYPLAWTRVLNTRYASIGGVGSGGWDHSFDWHGWVRFGSNAPCYGDCTPYEGADAHVEYPDGRVVDFYQDGGNLNMYRSWLGAEPGDRVLRDLSDNGWDLKLKDGGAVHFGPTGSTGTVGLVAQRVTDPYGQTINFQLDGSNRLWRIVEPGGRYLQINYTQLWVTEVGTGFYVDFIQSVQAFGSSGNLTQTVTYNYTAIAGDYGIRQYLTRVDYDDGTYASYSYQTANVPNPTTTGTTATWKAYQLIKTCNDVRYAGPMSQIEYQFEQAGDSSSVAFGQVKAEKNANTHQVVSQVQYPTTLAPQPGDTASQTRVETRGDGFSRTFVYGTGYPGNPPETTAPGVLNTYTDFKNQLSKITYYGSPDLPGNFRTKTTDALSRVSYLDWHPVTCVPLKVTHPDNSYMSYSYYDEGAPDYASLFLASQTDENQHTTSYVRDGQHRIVQTNYPDGSTENFTYNNFGQVLTHKLRSGGTEAFEYDNTTAPPTRGLKTKHTDPFGNVTTYGYYSSGPNTDRLYMVIDPRNNATAYEYNQRGQVTKIQHQDGAYTQSSYNNDATLAWTADENHPGAVNDPNQRTRYTYDEYKRVLTVTNPMGETTTNYYGLDWANPLLHTTNSIKYATSPMNKNVVYDYDANFRKIDQAVALGTADEAWTLFEYDAGGNLTKTTDPRGNVTTFGYDNRDRKLWMNDPIAIDRNSNGHTMEWQYDGVGNKLKEIRADNAFRSWEYDIPNRITRAIDWRMSTAELAITTTTTRDLPDPATHIAIEHVVDAKNAEYKFEIDALGRKIRETYPPDASNNTARFVYWHFDE